MGQSKGRVRALFLDRDGVINVDLGHVHTRSEFQFVPGIFDLCRAAQAEGYLLIVVTNQAGIGRGYYSEADFLALTRWMVAKFAEEGSRIARVYYCPYHPVHGVGAYRRDSPERKPEPGMLLRARADFDLDLSSSALIGDKLADMHAACAAGVGTRILVGSGSRCAEVPHGRYWVVDSLDEARCRLLTSVPGG